VLVIGIDPGLTTGVAVYDPQKEELIAALAARAWSQVAELLDELREQPTRKIVVVEDFIGQGPRNENADHTLKTIGFVTGLSLWFGFTVHTQQPQARKRKLPEAKAVLSGTPYGIHIADALAHAMVYSNRKKAAKQLKPFAHREEVASGQRD
jgi:hypothetical protein